MITPMMVRAMDIKRVFVREIPKTNKRQGFRGYRYFAEMKDGTVDVLIEKTTRICPFMHIIPDVTVRGGAEQGTLQRHASLSVNRQVDPKYYKKPYLTFHVEADAREALYTPVAGSV